MPPQQSYGLLDAFGDLFDLGLHGNTPVSDSFSTGIGAAKTAVNSRKAKAQ
jgi:hypothetical protein